MKIKNKQPWYGRAEILITTVNVEPEEDFIAEDVMLAIEKVLKKKYGKNSVYEIALEHFEGQYGDPSDLM